jgi:hypothetical protein
VIINFKQSSYSQRFYDTNTDIITKGATKLYEERMGPDKAALDRGAAAVKRLKQMKQILNDVLRLVSLEP